LSSRKGRYSIRNPHSFRGGASRNAMKIDNRFEELLERRKEEINQLIRDLASSKSISILNSGTSRRSVFFRLNIDNKLIEFKFIIWTDYQKKGPDYTNARFARFILGVNENIDELRFKVLDYFERIQKGSTIEYVYALALEELEREHRILTFYKTGTRKDKEGIDFVIMVLKDGRQTEMPYQVKSSYEALMLHKEKYPEIPGSHNRSTGNLREDTDRAKAKTIKVINDYKEGIITLL